jgi:hypothetical protein
MSQPVTALAYGQQIRRVAVAARRRVEAQGDTRRGYAQLAGEIEASPRWPRKLRVAQALAWAPRSHALQRQRLLAHAGCSEHRTLNELTDRQRHALCGVLREPSAWRASTRAKAA